MDYYNKQRKHYIFVKISAVVGNPSSRVGCFYSLMVNMSKYFRAWLAKHLLFCKKSNFRLEVIMRQFMCRITLLALNASYSTQIKYIYSAYKLHIKSTSGSLTATVGMFMFLLSVLLALNVQPPSARSGAPAKVYQTLDLSLSWEIILKHFASPSPNFTGVKIPKLRQSRLVFESEIYNILQKRRCPPLIWCSFVHLAPRRRVYNCPKNGRANLLNHH